jgi:hypothetical protein
VVVLGTALIEPGQPAPAADDTRRTARHRSDTRMTEHEHQPERDEITSAMLDDGLQKQQAWFAALEELRAETVAILTQVVDDATVLPTVTQERETWAAYRDVADATIEALRPRPDQ